MARRTFFSFHHARDSWRAGQIRNSDMLSDSDELGFIDAVEWEALKQQGDAAVERWIQFQLKSTSVTVILIGAQTAHRRWVRYEIEESWGRGNGLVGVTIHNIKDRLQRTDVAGRNPLDEIYIANRPLSSFVKTYDWVWHDGRRSLGSWIEEAYQARR